MSERYVLAVSPAASLDRVQPPAMNRVLSQTAAVERMRPAPGKGGRDAHFILAVSGVVSSM